jgi:hypothetical protein
MKTTLVFVSEGLVGQLAEAVFTSSLFPPKARKIRNLHSQKGHEAQISEAKLLGLLPSVPHFYYTLLNKDVLPSFHNAKTSKELFLSTPGS